MWTERVRILSIHSRLPCFCDVSLGCGWHISRACVRDFFVRLSITSLSFASLGLFHQQTRSQFNMLNQPPHKMSTIRQQRRIGLVWPACTKQPSRYGQFGSNISMLIKLNIVKSWISRATRSDFATKYISGFENQCIFLETVAASRTDWAAGQAWSQALAWFMTNYNALFFCCTYRCPIRFQGWTLPGHPWDTHLHRTDILNHSAYLRGAGETQVSRELYRTN